jgi:predicted O-methyltransferase YrrM
MNTLRSCLGFLLLILVVACQASAAEDGPGAADGASESDERVQRVIDEVEKSCRDRHVPMIGPEKAERLAELIREKKPKVVLECGTAIGYSGLWVARELKRSGHGRLITIEIDPRIAAEAKENFERAGLADVVEVRVGDARKLSGEVEGPIDFAFIDCNFGNYMPCFEAMEKNLADGATIVADNVGIGATSMKPFLDLVRERYETKTEWFDLDLPWAKRDAIEIITFTRKSSKSK